jgi:hypothetical protein
VTDYRQLLACTDEELGRADVLEMNLLVAKSIPSLAHLEIPRYQRQADAWAEAVRRRLPNAEKVFWQTPWDWKNDLNFFRLGVLCGFLDKEAGIEYIEEQKYARAVRYTNPSDLFLNGVMDTRRGTCGNMAALHVALGRRLGWPVSLACARSHCICRYDDGKVTHNIEATHSGGSGFQSDSDEYLIKREGLTRKAITSGSDLRALTVREMLGIFLGFRGRHMKDTGRWEEADKDYLLARHLFPNSQDLYCKGMGMAVKRGAHLFEPDEEGSLQSLSIWLASKVGTSRPPMQNRPSDNGVNYVMASRVPVHGKGRR